MSYFMGEYFSTGNSTVNFGLIKGLQNRATNDTRKVIDESVSYADKKMREQGSKYAKELKDNIPEYWRKLKKNKTARRVALGFATLQGLQALTGIHSGAKMLHGGFDGVKRLVTRKPKEQKTSNFSALVHTPLRNERVTLSKDQLKLYAKLAGKATLGVGAIGGGVYGLNKYMKYRKNRKQKLFK